MADGAVLMSGYQNYSLDNRSNFGNVTVPGTDLARTIILTLTLATVVLATVFGNSLVVFAVLRMRTLRSVTNYFIVSLAVSDLALGILILPMSSTYEILGYWVFGQRLCVLWCTLDVMCCTASILNLVAISIDRYLAINKPMMYLNISNSRRAFVAIVFVWILAVLISVPPLGWRDQSEDRTQCELTSGKGYVIYSACGSFFIPLIVMLCVYYRIYVTAVAQTEKIKRGSNLGSLKKCGYKSTKCDTEVVLWKESTKLFVSRTNSQNSTSAPNSREGSLRDVKKRSRNMGKRLKRFSREKKAAKTLAIVVGAFILCWFPFFSVYLLREICNNCVVPPMLFKFFFWLGYCNSFLNPIIYPCLNREFRAAFRKILCRPWCRTPDLDYYDTPTRSVKAIRATRRLRMSIAHQSSSSATPPDSPSASLLRKQSQLRRMSRLLEQIERSDTEPEQCEIPENHNGSSVWNYSSSRTSSCHSRVHSSHSEPAIDKTAKSLKSIKTSKTSDCIRLLADEYPRHHSLKRLSWCKQPREIVTRNWENIEMIQLSSRNEHLSNFNDTDEQQEAEPSLLSPVNIEISLKDSDLSSSKYHSNFNSDTSNIKSTDAGHMTRDKFMISSIPSLPNCVPPAEEGFLVDSYSVFSDDNSSSLVCDMSHGSNPPLVEFTIKKQIPKEVSSSGSLELQDFFKQCNHSSSTL